MAPRSRRGVSAVLASIALFMIISSGVLLLAAVAGREASTIESMLRLEEARAKSRLAGSAYRTVERGGGVLVEGLDASRVDGILVIRRSGQIERLDSTCVLPEPGGALVTGGAYEALKSGDTVVLLLESGGSVRLDALPSKRSSDIDFEEVVITGIVQGVLGPQDSYRIFVEETDGMLSSNRLALKLPVGISVKVYDIKYILETYRGTCPFPYRRVLYWGASAGYEIEVYHNGTLVKSKSGRLEFVEFSPGTARASESLRATIESTLKGAGALEFTLDSDLWVSLTASSPSPFYSCAQSWSYSWPTGYAGGVLTLNLWYRGQEVPLLVVLSDGAGLWTDATGAHKNDVGFAGYTKLSDGFVLYYNTNPVLSLKHAVEGRSSYAAELRSTEPQVEVVLLELARRQR
uniref:Uncharacterized protein n=1 Tax=Fervidicoccus fontis TaxID=683846 RepID=A0A7J3ZKR2_9CREN